MIVKLKPALKEYIWGGTNLINYWNKQSQTPTVAESWELSFHSQGQSIVDSGVDAGKQLAQVATRKHWGKNCNDFEMFPVLIKLIDSQSNLSVQVHPSDDYALQREGQYGKTEMWHILQAQKGACLYLGLNKTLTPQQFATAVSDGSIMDYLNKVPVSAGETYFIPSGTIHAIGAGVTLIEIQQNSALTYRLYDYNRLQSDGKPRQLHVEKGLQVANLNKYDVPNAFRQEVLGSCKYFTSCKYVGNHDFYNADSFLSLTVVDGSVNVSGISLAKGETIFASAGEKVCVDGNGSYVCTWVDAH